MKTVVYTDEKFMDLWAAYRNGFITEGEMTEDQWYDVVATPEEQARARRRWHREGQPRDILDTEMDYERD